MIKQLYEQYKQDIYGYLFSLTHNASLSEDLLSETFLAALTAIARFEGQSDLKTWLFSIARHKWYEHLRKQRPTVPLDELSEHYLSDALPIGAQLLQQEVTEGILQCLSTLDNRTQRIVRLRIEGYSFQEIARLCQVSEGSARVIDFRAKQKIKDFLAKEGLYEP